MPEATLDRPPYLDDVRRLLADATEHRREHELADLLAWTLAVLMVEHGGPAVSGVLASLGGHMRTILERKNAQEQAEHERRRGVATH